MKQLVPMCLVLVTIPAVAFSQIQACLNGKVYQDCGTACPLTCDNYLSSPLFCTKQCVQGCFCPAGMVQLETQDTQGCVAPENCPAPPLVTQLPPLTTIPPPATVPACSNNMVYTTCGTACPRTCENRDQFTPCTLQCVVGCFCPFGTVMHDERCIDEKDCPAPTTVPQSPPTNVPPPTTVPLPSLQPSTPVVPTCTNNMVWTVCGSACPLTCANMLEDIACTEQCVQGCFCPNEMAMHEGSCINPTECPATATQAPTPSPSCTNGRVYRECGPLCPQTCVGDAPLLIGCFSLRCGAPGCYCPESFYELNDQECVEQCPGTPPPTSTNLPPTVSTAQPPPTCTGNKVYDVCGSQCPPSCDMDLLIREDCLTPNCVSGCFCPQGYIQHGDGCVEQCPDITPIAPTDPTCEINNGGCNYDQECMSLCYPSDEGERCTTLCKEAPYVLCGSDAFLACDSEWTWCLQQNKTRRADCVSSCLSLNGNCPEDSTCVTTVSEDQRTHMQCLERDELSTECPAGMVVGECGDLCQDTCEQHLTGLPRPCPRICGPPACICPQGLVLYRDRCVDPKLCYILVNYPPPFNPLPLVDTNMVLVSLSTSVDINRITVLKDVIVASIEAALLALGYPDINVDFHGLYSQAGRTEIMIALFGDDIREESVQILDGLREQAYLLAIDVLNFLPVEVDYVVQQDYDDEDSHSDSHDGDGDHHGDGNGDSDEDSSVFGSLGLSQNSIIWIAVSSGVAGIAVVVAWIAVVVLCCVLRGRNSTHVEADKKNTESNIYSAIILQEKGDTDKGKMLLESLDNY